jgi:hypothetical protein
MKYFNNGNPYKQPHGEVNALDGEVLAKSIVLKR